MSTEGSKNPDYLLTLVKKDEGRGGQGKLKVFLGMVAGVGKTYAMLQAARQLKGQGVDVVIGLVETHGREETAAVAVGLEEVPRRNEAYRGVEVTELDLDQVLRRRPKVVLIDELAHTNASGSRHQKRYLDVIELLEAGIDVYTTLNVQHIESRIDTVQDITRISVHETVPDSILDRADEVVLIDLPPEDLLKRLSEGRIYPGDSAEVATRNFFQRGNLTALREMALRVAAERVDRDLREYKALHGIDAVWKAGGRLMVAVFASPYSEVLIRWTRRVADLLGVTWIGAYVEGDRGLSDDEKKLLTKNISLVTQLGGEVVATRDSNAVRGLLRIANQNAVTQIIVGKSQRGWLKRIFSGGSTVNRLLRQSGPVDVYVVATSKAKMRRTQLRASSVERSAIPWDQLGWVFAIALGTWMLAGTLEFLIGYRAVGIVFLVAVSLAGLQLARFSIFLLALLFAFIHNFFFIPPIYTISVREPEDLMLLAMYFIAAATIGHLTTRLADKERMLKSRENRAVTLYGLAKDIGTSQSVQQIVDGSLRNLEGAIDARFTILLRSDANGSRLSRLGGYVLDAKEEAVAAWVMINGRLAGRGTETLVAAGATYFPITGKSGVFGVLGVMPKKDETTLDPGQLTLIETFLSQIAAGIERETYHERIRSLLVVEETQKLYKSLLDCVSHELKTPLAAIKGSASALLDRKTSSNEVSVLHLGQEILDASGRLQRLVENLLDMTRIESGMLKPREEICDLTDIIGTVVGELRSVKGAHPIRISIPNDLPPVVCDPVLMDRALANILHNAFIYTQPDSEVFIDAAKVGDDRLQLNVRDCGPGLPQDNPGKVMEKFFRASPNTAGGTGLGLSIARGFIELQGGTLSASNHPGGGAVFTVTLPQAGEPA